MAKGLIILLGESFRNGNQNSRIRSLPCTYEEQKEACMSHLRWMKKLEDLNISTDLVINSYNTRYNEDLLYWYDTKCINSNFFPDVIGLNNLYFDCITRWKELFTNYNFVHFLRIDLFLKPFFFDKFKLDDKIRYSSICYTKSDCHITSCRNPRVSDTMLYIPKTFYHLLNNDILNHSGWPTLLSLGIQSNDIDVYVNTFHDSDSAKDWNPLYRIVNRVELKNWFSKNQIFDGTPHPKNENNANIYDDMI
jgi:hypothetical protein